MWGRVWATAGEGRRRRVVTPSSPRTGASWKVGDEVRSRSEQERASLLFTQISGQFEVNLDERHHRRRGSESDSKDTHRYGNDNGLREASAQGQFQLCCFKTHMFKVVAPGIS